MTFIDQLTTLFNANANAANASAMKAYMKNHFEFYGIKATLRRELLKKILVSHKEYVANNPKKIAQELYHLPYRELHLCAMEIYEKQMRKKYQASDIDTIEFLITKNSWWDTVDYIAKNILGHYLLMYPEATEKVLSKFTKSDDMWLNRSSIIYQLGYKTGTNQVVLFQQCTHFKESKEFFIQKAIGWALREYAKTNPKEVLNFVNSTQLKPLSHREAIRSITK